MKTYKKLTEELGLCEARGYGLDAIFDEILEYFDKEDKIDSKGKILLTVAFVIASSALPLIAEWFIRSFIPLMKKWYRMITINKEISANDVRKLLTDIEDELYNLESDEFAEYLGSLINTYSNKLKGGAYDKQDLVNMKKDIIANLSLIHVKKNYGNVQKYPATKYRKRY